MSLRQDVGEICTQIREGKNSMINKFKNSLSRLDHSPRRNEMKWKRIRGCSEPERAIDLPWPRSSQHEVLNGQHQAPRKQGAERLQHPQLPERRRNRPAEVSWGFPRHSNRLWLLREHPIASSQPVTFGWSSDMAKLVTEHKSEVLNKEQGQMKVTMRQMTSNKPSDVSSVSSWQEFETSCLLLREDG